MTPRQRWVVGVLAIANIAVLLTLLVFAIRFPGAMPQPEVRSPVPTLGVDSHLSPTCRRLAVEMLSQVDLGGTVTLADSVIRFDLRYRVRGDGPAEDAGQQVWKAFDVALALAERGCGMFSRLEVVVEPQGAPAASLARATVDRIDLEAYAGGELSEAEFIDRVQYRVESADSGPP